MAIVREYVHPTIGCTIRVHDDDVQCSPEEMEKRHEELDRVIYQILRDPKNRERLRQFNLEHYGEE